MGNSLRNVRSLSMYKREMPLIVVLGCTGTGKSKLAIELAKKFDGQIISADSMQVYKGLDIVTNKVSAEEQVEAVHHCIDSLNPLYRYTVVDFHNQCLPIINNLLSEKKTPIIVGGTNYYIESLLWDVLIKPEEAQGKLLYEYDKEFSPISVEKSEDIKNAKALLKNRITHDSLNHVSSSELHKCLHEIDSAMASSLHPEDRRKIIRSLQVYQQTGFCHSDLLEMQRSKDGGSSLGGPLRFKNTIMFWLQCDKEVLDKRLDDRVDDMLARGLLSELTEFHSSYNKNRSDLKHRYTEGIFQSIGFKEFHDYLVLSNEDKETEHGKKLLKKAIEDMKIATRQYSRKQTKWIVNRFLRKPDRQLPPVYDLQASNLDLWEENVLQPAIEIITAFIKGEKSPVDPLPVEESIQDVSETHYCDICEKIFVSRRIWESITFFSEILLFLNYLFYFSFLLLFSGFCLTIIVLPHISWHFIKFEINQIFINLCLILTSISEKRLKN